MEYILSNLLTILILYFIAYYVVFMISFYVIFKKANIPQKKALIPLINFYYYMKICHLSWWWLLVPIINILVIFFSPMLIAYHFGQKRLIGVCGVIFPIPFYLYIAFSNNVTYIHKELPDLNLKRVEDIDNLENKIINSAKNSSVDQFVDDFDSNDNASDVGSTNSEFESFIQNIDSAYASSSNDDILIEDTIIEKNVKTEPIEQNLNNDVIEIDDDIENISIDNLESLEINSINNSVIEKVDNSEYKEIMEEEKKVEDIAFDNKNTNMVIKQEKELTCPNCGSSLIGYHDFCPGCNRDIRELTNG